mmetsp:Transcript_7616/g.16586  ORF Transcript_7616/g.16586 Transcript_7616/m.16586 type:complete len:87 (+) Transcript_7616:245-505(+)
MLLFVATYNNSLHHFLIEFWRKGLDYYFWVAWYDMCVDRNRKIERQTELGAIQKSKSKGRMPKKRSFFKVTCVVLSSFLCSTTTYL